MSWSKKVRRPADVLKAGEQVEVVVLGVNAADRRISLGLKQALGDPWADAAQKLPVGSVVEGPITSIQKFGAFVQVAEGVEGMVHVGDISAEKRINHPQDVVRVGQVVKAQVLELDVEKRRLRLGMKQLIPTSLDEYIAEHKEGDVVTGRMTDVSSGRAKVELGEGVHATCRLAADATEAGTREDEKQSSDKVDLSSMTSILQARWKGGQGGGGGAKVEGPRSGQIRSLHHGLDPAPKRRTGAGLGVGQVTDLPVQLVSGSDWAGREPFRAVISGPAGQTKVSRQKARGARQQGSENDVSEQRGALGVQQPEQRHQGLPHAAKPKVIPAHRTENPQQQLSKSGEAIAHQDREYRAQQAINQQIERDPAEGPGVEAVADRGSARE
jgi:predicted RNA-binding protein with RPS1 domain